MDKFNHRMVGFTLMEMVIVIVIIGILAVYPLLKWPGKPINVLAQAQVIASDLRYAQTLSMSTESCYRVVQSSTTSYQITNGSANVMFPTGVTIMSLNTDISFGTWSPTGMVAFNSRGIPFSDACSTALSSNASIIVSDGITSKTITINQVTGMVTIS